MIGEELTANEIRKEVILNSVKKEKEIKKWKILNK